MKRTLLAAAAVVLALGLSAPSPAQADTLKMQVRREQGQSMPTRGMSMAQVEKRFGAPTRKLPTRGGGSKYQPPINRWVYPGYVVYFERSTVIHSVLDAPRGEKPYAP